jgi:hypothetical protein
MIEKLNQEIANGLKQCLTAAIGGFDQIFHRAPDFGTVSNSYFALKAGAPSRQGTCLPLRVGVSSRQDAHPDSRAGAPSRQGVLPVSRVGAPSRQGVHSVFGTGAPSRQGVRPSLSSSRRARA